MHGLQYEPIRPLLLRVKLDNGNSVWHFGHILRSDSIMRSNQILRQSFGDDNTHSEQRNAQSPV
jgi:hypothetical protein